MQSLASSATTPPRSFLGSSTGVFAFLVGGVAIHLIYLAQSDTAGFYLLGLLALLQVSPFLFGLLRKSFSYLEFALASQFIFFTEGRLSALITEGGTEALPPEYLSAVKEMIICSLLVIVAHSFFRPLLNKKREGEVGHEYLYLPPMQKKIVALFLLGSAFGARQVPDSVFIPFMMVTGLFSVLAVTTRDSRNASDGWFTRGVLGVSAIGYFMTTGSMMLMGQYTTYYFIMAAMRGTWRMLPSLVPIIVLLGVVQTVKADYRRVMLAEQADTASVADKMGFLSESIALQFGLQEELSTDDRGEKVVQGLSRIGDNSLELILSQTPSLVPFWEGESYATIPYMFIPRMLWPEKPSRDFWNKLGKVYGVLGSDDEDTSVGVNVFAEGYMNFGYTGMYLVAVGMGLILVLAELMGTVFLGGKTYFGFIYFYGLVGNFSMDLGSILQSLFINSVLVLVLRLVVLQPNERDAYGVAR